jgi:hypothetical protein
VNIRVHIERLELSGIRLEERHGPVVQAAVQAELARLLAEGRMTSRLAEIGSAPRIDGRPFSVPTNIHPARLGEEIARSVHGGLGR